MDSIQAAVEERASDVIRFARDLVRTKSYSGREEKVIRLIEAKMNSLGYDEVFIDAMGNVVGRVGSGEKVLLFDSHIDTVAVTDETAWTHDPFGGIIKDGRLYGRGSVDMKSAAAASVYAGAVAKKCGCLDGKTVYVSCTVMEEDCDGENLKHLFQETGINPDYAVICEPSGNKLVTGHKGKAQIAVSTRGISAHGSAPEKGLNAIYEMAGIIERIERTADALHQDREKNGTLVASNISSRSESLNAVPFACEIYLDRRLAPGETKALVEKEMDAIVKGKNASWEIGTLYRKSWTGMAITYQPFHPPWEIEPEHALARICTETYTAAFGIPPELDFWDFSTNAVATVPLGIPTIGFGPGEYKLAHMVDENCETRQIIDACTFYAGVMDRVA